MQVAAASAEPPAAAAASAQLATEASSKEDEDAFFKLALSAPSYESHRASPAKAPAHTNIIGVPEPDVLEPSKPSSQVDDPTPAADRPAVAPPSSKAETLALWASVDVESSPAARLGSPAQRSGATSKGPFANLAVDTSAAALEPGVPSPTAGVSPKPQGSRIRASTPTRGSRVASLAERFSEPSPLAARPPSPQRFRESQLAAKSSPLMGARPVNRSIDVRASTGSLRASMQVNSKPVESLIILLPQVHPPQPMCTCFIHNARVSSALCILQTQACMRALSLKESLRKLVLPGRLNKGVMGVAGC